MSALRPEPPRLDTRRVLVVSPHLDDAVLSCGHLLATAHTGFVVTVFGGAPVHYPATGNDWDRRCGFGQGDDIVALRRAEDSLALALLGVSGTTLDFVDRTYRDTKKYDLDAIAREIRGVIDSFAPTTVVAPLAILHADHKASLAATLRLREASDGRDWAVYAEFPYLWREPDATVRRLSTMRRSGYRLTAIPSTAIARNAKADALRAYKSQIVGLELAEDIDRVAAASELMWTLSDLAPLPLRAARWVGYRTGILK